MRPFALCNSSHRSRDQCCKIPAGAVNFGDSCVPLKIVFGHGTYLRLILEPVGTQPPYEDTHSRTAATNSSHFWWLLLQRKGGAAERPWTPTKRQRIYSGVKPAFLLCLQWVISFRKNSTTITIRGCTSVPGLLIKRDRIYWVRGHHLCLSTAPFAECWNGFKWFQEKCLAHDTMLFNWEFQSALKHNQIWSTST